MNNQTQGPKTKEDTLFHNTEILLKNYREITWSIELAAFELSDEVEENYFTSMDNYLDILYSSGVDKYAGRIASLAQNAEISKQLITVLHKALDIIREKHEKGEEYYWIIYYTYLYKTKLSLEQVLSSLAGKGYACGYRTYYRRREEAIEILSVVLWGCTAKHFDFVSLCRKTA